ncbi:MAG: phosphatase PAP2 family protein [Ignavibacteriaceae bacterium]
MKTKLISIISGLIFFTSVSSAQVFDKVGSDIGDFLKVGGSVFTAPFNFDSGDWTNFAITTSAVGGAFFLDNTARKFSQQDHTNFKNDLFDIDQYYKTQYAVIATAGIYGVGLLTNNDRIRNVGLQLGESLIYAGIITVTLKSLIGRSRPYTQRGHSDFHPFSVSDDKVSFPSGHATVAFAFSTVMAHQVDNIFWKAGWFGAAGLVSYARLYHDRHWVSDVIMGGAVGYFIGRLVVNHPTNNPGQKELSEKKNKPVYSVGVNFRENQPVYTLNFGYQF